MADEQHEWLDKEAAERLLRGEPVDPVGGLSCPDAERLAVALGALARTTRPATAELPGEAAALAAFRGAPRPGRSRTCVTPRVKPYAADGEEAGGAGLLDPVRIRPPSSGTPAAPSPRPRRARWSRPVRFGLVASLAGCVLGGVAVAAGTGVLSGSFGGHTPGPAASVSAAASPQELGSGLTVEETPVPPAPTSSPTRRPAASDRPEPGTSAPDARPGGRPSATGGGRATPGSSGDDPSGAPDATGTPKTPGGSGDGTSGSWYARAYTACRDYRDGSLGGDRRHRLESLAKGAGNLARFCDRVLGKGGGEGSGGGRDDDDGEQQSSRDDDGSGGGATRTSLVPTARFALPVSPRPASPRYAGPSLPTRLFTATSLSYTARPTASTTPSYGTSAAPSLAAAAR